MPTSPAPSHRRRLARQGQFTLHPLSGMLAMALSACVGLAQASPSGVVISQVYGAGGNSGALLNSDYIELFNAGTAAVNLNGWSVQYASATGTSWSNKTVLGNITLQPGQYLLIKEGSGTNGAALPTADVTGSILMGAAAGKVALVTGSTTLTGSAPSGAEDIVSYGSSTPTEGSPAPALSTTLAAWRLNHGCQDTGNNSADFSTAAPAPRNSQSALAPCGDGGPRPLTPIHDIQGNGPASPLLAQTVSTRGVVTRLVSNGFFMQDDQPDNDPATSEGIFVFTASAPTLAVGDKVQLSAVVDEFNGATELKSVTGLSVLSSGHMIVPTPIAFPEIHEGDLEQVEGMVVTIAQTLTASQNYFQGRYGQVTLSAQGRLKKATNLYRPGSADALQVDADNARRRLVLDDGSSLQNPNPTPYIGEGNTLRAGDTIDGITGVIDEGLVTASSTGPKDHKIHPTQPVVFTRVNARSATPASVSGNVRVASFNVLNYFNGDGLGGGFPTSRGATTPAEFQRQRAKIIAAIRAIDADVLGLMEMENDGSGPNSAVQDLVNGLNAAMGAGTYALVPDPSTGTGSDEIKVAMIYKPARLNRVGASVSDASAIHNRPPLAQTFSAANGERFTLVVNHFKSKSCTDASGADADQLDGQGCYNARRVQQAQALRSFISGLQSATGDGDVLVMGDLNAYAKEDPIHDLGSNGLRDMVAAFNGQDGYSYVFDGEAGYLDHALASPTLQPQVSGALEWHINADEPSVIDYNTEFKQPACAGCGPDYYTATPWRSSDHDPVLIGLNLVKTLNGSSASETLTGTPGDDRIQGGAGADTITTGAGHDTVVYTSLRDALDTIQDFVPGQDRVDLHVLLAGIATSLGRPIDALGEGFVQLVDTNGGVEIRIDSDGLGGAGSARALLRLQGLTRTQLQAARDLIL
ncbi:MAG: ExeM/NucH family extracellular endonuclease [Aquabacterium sp.]